MIIHASFSRLLLYIYYDISKISYTLSYAVYVFNVSEMTLSEVHALAIAESAFWHSFAEWYAFGICFMQTAEVDRGVHSFKGLSFFIQWPSHFPINPFGALLNAYKCWTYSSSFSFIYIVVNRWQ